MTTATQEERREALAEAYALLARWGRERLAREAHDKADDADVRAETSGEVVT